MERALTRWEEKLRPFIEDTQRGSLKSRALFTPANEAQRVVRAVSIRLMSNRLTGPIVKKVMRDRDLKAKMIDIEVRGDECTYQLGRKHAHFTMLYGNAQLAMEKHPERGGAGGERRAVARGEPSATRSRTCVPSLPRSVLKR